MPDGGRLQSCVIFLRILHFRDSEKVCWVPALTEMLTTGPAQGAWQDLVQQAWWVHELLWDRE